jgi:hypothetical protein
VLVVPSDAQKSMNMGDWKPPHNKFCQLTSLPTRLDISDRKKVEDVSEIVLCHRGHRGIIADTEDHRTARFSCSAILHTSSPKEHFDLRTRNEDK